MIKYIIAFCLVATCILHSTQATPCADPLCKASNAFRTVFALSQNEKLLQQHVDQSLTNTARAELDKSLQWIKHNMTLTQAQRALELFETMSWVTPMVLPCAAASTKEEQLMDATFALGIAIYCYLFLTSTISLVLLIFCKIRVSASAVQ
jgi:hypothetical protein